MFQSRNRSNPGKSHLLLTFFSHICTNFFNLFLLIFWFKLQFICRGSITFITFTSTMGCSSSTAEFVMVVQFLDRGSSSGVGVCSCWCLSFFFSNVVSAQATISANIQLDVNNTFV